MIHHVDGWMDGRGVFFLFSSCKGVINYNQWKTLLHGSVLFYFQCRLQSFQDFQVFLQNLSSNEIYGYTSKRRVPLFFLSRPAMAACTVRRVTASEEGRALLTPTLATRSRPKKRRRSSEDGWKYETLRSSSKIMDDLPPQERALKAVIKGRRLPARERLSPVQLLRLSCRSGLE